MSVQWRVLLERLRGTFGRNASPQLILGIGAVALAVMVLVALVPDRFSMAGLSGGELAMGPGGAAAVPAALPGLTPFVPVPPLSFGGRVTQVASIGSEMGWGQVHVWLDNGTGLLLEVSVAPQSYLKQINCPPLDGARISGVGFRFDPNRPNAEVYAKSIMVGGKTCRLRDDEGLALWMAVQ
ncbi:hypothetical protein [Magnetospirillum sp. UT-4]|uniref:hypothetical protein n=1 Tax=Magnetospirillum sp. UT-4 TaxID=2681467 RepID=UPI00137EDBE7|nr:hypothetical protein [Magnetospirillum sp. UT-4]CAA7622255.1 conserved hypothetical protein [Magnetospirillum sp. UT-4]